MGLDDLVEDVVVLREARAVDHDVCLQFRAIRQNDARLCKLVDGTANRLDLGAPGRTNPDEDVGLRKQQWYHVRLFFISLRVMYYTHG